MGKNLQQFDLLCEEIQMNILGQKKHSFLHNLRPFARKYRYVQQDFLTLWNKSCFDKLKGALLGTNLNFNLKQIKVPNGQRDIYIGTNRPGVFLRYKILQSDQKYLITQILRKLKSNSTNDDLATWRAYIQEQIALCQTQNKQFRLPMELQIISRIKTKQNISFQQKKPAQISQFNSNGFDGNIYLWFDLSQFKEQIKNILDKNAAIDDNTNYLIQQIQQTNNQNQQQINLHLTNPSQDKILLGTFDIKLVESNKLGIVGMGGKIITGHADDLVADTVKSLFGKFTGNNGSKSEKPTLIRKHLSLFSPEKPFVQVISSVDLKDWLYDVQQSPQRKYLGKEGSKQNVSGLTKFPFVLANVKKGYDPRETTQLSENKCWSVGNYSGNSKWEYKPITKEWLLDDTLKEHLITLRFQSWVKRNNGFYFDYRFVFNLSGFYNIEQTIENLYNERMLNIIAIAKKHNVTDTNKIESFLNKKLNDGIFIVDDNQLSSFNDNEKSTIGELLAQLKYKKSCNKIKLKESEKNNFVAWFKNYITQMEKYRPDEFTKASVDKIIYNNKNQMVGRDSHIQSSFQAFKQRDITGFEFLHSILNNMDKYTVEGEYLNNIFNISNTK